jgi:Zn-dependent peptidase ImmA (M78 family)
MPIAGENIKNIYNILKKNGLDANFVREVVLPEWWSDELASSKAGYLQALGIIAKNLAVDIRNLMERPETLSLKENINVRFKSAKNISMERNSFWTRSLSLRMSEILEKIFPREVGKVSEEPIELRTFMVENYGEINLTNALDYLWSSGIPVIYISQFPKDLYKMDGMVILSKTGPVIMISKSRRHEAWLLFVLMHELGHYIKGHLSSEQNVIYDESLAFEIKDEDENQANQAALTILTGSAEPQFLSEEIESAFRLANQSRRLGSTFKLDPGVIALNYAYHHKSFFLAEQSLKILDPKADAVNLIKKKMQENLEIGELTEENQNYFLRLTHLTSE